jgi:SAM-dependent methyltransferase
MEHLLKSGVLPKTGVGLDLGCGDGRLTKIIMEKADVLWQLIGLDADPEEISIAKETGIYEKLHISDAAQIDEPDNSFDFVFSNSVLEHIFDLKPVLAELNRVLKPGGKFIFTVPSSAFPNLLGGPGFFGWLATGETDRSKYLHALDARVAHLRYWDEHSWRPIFQQLGMTLVHASYYLSRAELRRWEFLSNVTAGLLVRLSGGDKAPIKIQRTLKIRREQHSLWLRMFAYSLGIITTIGLRSEKSNRTDEILKKACFLGVAQKIT